MTGMVAMRQPDARGLAAQASALSLALLTFARELREGDRIERRVLVESTTLPGRVR